MVKESIKITGTAVVEIINAKTGKIIKTVKCKNLIVNGGLKVHRNWAAGIAAGTDADYNVDTRIDQIAVGDDDTPPAKTQTTLGNLLLQKEVWGTPDSGCGINLIDNETVEYFMLIGTGELNGETIREVALISETAQATTIMISRFLTGNLVKSSNVQFIIKYRFKYS